MTPPQPTVDELKQGFTPGPWRLEQDTTVVWGCCNANDQSNYGMGYPVAECRITPAGRWAKGPWADEGVANARLIAVSPALFQLALQYRDDLRYPPAPDSVERRLAAIEAVIAKVSA